MEQVNAYVFYLLGSRLQAAFLGARLPIKVYLHDVQFVIGLLDMLLDGGARFKLDDSAAAARALRQLLGSVVEIYTNDNEAMLDEHNLQLLNYGIKGFDAAFSLELGRAPIFFVAPRGVFDMRRLIAEAPSVYEGYADRLPDKAIEETRLAGRCLAFSLATAAGFHIARATESVVRMQMEVFGCPPIKESQRNLGTYINLLANAGANPKVLHHLKQYKDLHRNPLIHPEVTLTMPEGLSLWSTCVSLIQAMVADMESKRNPADPQITAMLPPDEFEEVPPNSTP